MRLFARALQLQMQWLFSKATDTAAALFMGSVQHGPLRTLVNGINVYKGV